jgi:hypothetical protein
MERMAKGELYKTSLSEELVSIYSEAIISGQI